MKTSKFFEHIKARTHFNTSADDFDIYRPASLYDAKKHLAATRTGTSSAEAPDLCACCGANANKKPFTLWSNTREFLVYGPVYKLAFDFMKFSIFVLLLNLGVTGIATMTSVSVIWGCLFSSCSEGEFKTQFEDSYYVTRLLGLLNIILLIGAKSYFLGKINAIKDTLSHTDAPEGYSVRITDIPREFSDINIVNSIRSIDGSYEVVKVNMVYNIRKYLRAVKRYLILQKEVKILRHKGMEYSKEYRQLKTKLDAALDQLYNIKREYEDRAKLGSKFTGVAFVSLMKQRQASDLLQKANRRVFRFRFTRVRTTIAPAPHPTDVRWKNYGLSKTQKVFRLSLTMVIATVLMAVSFFLIYNLSRIQLKLYNQNNGNFGVYVVALVISLVISIINVVLRLALRFSTKLERTETFTDFESSVVWKIALAIFLNTAIITLFANYSSGEFNVFQAKGILIQLGFIMTINMVVTGTFTFFDVEYFYILYRRYTSVKKIYNGELLQVEANDAFENQEFELALAHFNAVRALAIALFYQSVFPFGLIFGVIEVGYAYWAYKWQFVYRAQRPRVLNIDFSIQMVRFFELLIFICGLGYFVFDLILLPAFNPLSALILAISAFEAVVLPADELLAALRGRRVYSEKTYNEARLDFTSEYDRLNPMTQKKAYAEWLDFVELARRVNPNDIQIPQRYPGLEEGRENIMANLFDYATAGHTYGKGSKNVHSQENPFRRRDEHGKYDFLAHLNLYKLEEEADRKKARSALELVDNKDKTKGGYDILIDNPVSVLNEDIRRSFDAQKRCIDYFESKGIREVELKEMKDTKFLDFIKKEGYESLVNERNIRDIFKDYKYEQAKNKGAEIELIEKSKE